MTEHDGLQLHRLYNFRKLFHFLELSKELSLPFCFCSTVCLSMHQINKFMCKLASAETDIKYDICKVMSIIGFEDTRKKKHS